MQVLTLLAAAGVAVALPISGLSSRSQYSGTMTFNLDFNSNACDAPGGGNVVAIDPATFDSHIVAGYQGAKNPNKCSLCNKALTITNPKTGGTTTAIIVDRKGAGNGIDVSPSVVAALGFDQAAGHYQVGWDLPA